MIKTVFLRTVSLALLIVSFLTAKGQQVNTLYFMDNLPVRHYFNPSFQAYSDCYIELPVLGYTSFGLGNNSLTLKDVIYRQNGKSIYFLNEAGDKNKFFKTLRPVTLLKAEARVNLFGFGFRRESAYWTFDIAQRVDGAIGVPRDFMKLLLYGTPDMNSNVFDFQKLSFDASAYTEFALGYSRRLNDQWTVGGKLKYLYGNFNASLSNTSFDLTAGLDQWKLKVENVLNYAGPAILNMPGDIATLDLVTPAKVTNWLKPAGMGAGIDLGASYKVLPEFTLSAALLDLGMIRWKNNVSNITNTVDYTFDGLGSFGLDTKLNFENLTDSVIDAMKSATKSVQTANGYTTYTSPKLNIGGEYAFFNNKLSLGLLSQTTKRDKTYFQELTASANGRPAEWFNMSLSYSLLNGRFSNIGAAMGVRTGFLNWFASADYIALTYAKLPVTSGNTKYNIPIGYNSKGVNFAVGVSLVFGNRKDADHDGVVDKKDQCPETPFGVIVDKIGCPLDTDGDGVPDYLDKCPKTPKEAYNRIDQDGCPVDNDGDGVPDYKDKCPDTPKEAVAYVDSLGCIADTDKDGVYDYKDKCPETPLGAKVDSLGCPLDADVDGVPDYKDKCPDTPVAARNMVDSLGCPLDKDLDGVPDYMDKCPDTPAAERTSVDKDGCTQKKKVEVKSETQQANSDKDGDGDGVPDSIDKCPDTPAAARGMVDKNGCPLDSDGDGVPDYRDSCPKVPGSPANNGCPEIKKEVQSLLRKALQGIQFETGKYTLLPVSYTILNQIAGVMIANPTYVLEIRGHTDNVGNPAANLKLSDNRAKAVMKYLVNKGVAASRMTAAGFGDTLPVSSNKTLAGRGLNRRVEFVVTYHEISFE